MFPFRQVLALITLSLASVACAPDELVLGDRTWSGDNLEIWTTDDAVFCGGSFQALDRHASAVASWAEERGVPTRTERYRYYWASAAEFEAAEACKKSSVACFYSDREAVYAHGFFPHEIVHAEFASGHSSFVDEGMATLLGGLRFRQVPDDVDIPRLIDDTAGETLGIGNYEVAAKFMRATAELDPEGFLPASMTTRRDDGFESFAPKLSVDVRDAVDFDAAHRECWFDAVRIPISECSAPPLPWSTPELWEASGVVDCTNEATVGPNLDSDIWVTLPFDVPESGRYTLSFDGDAYVRLLRCDAGFCGEIGPWDVEGLGVYLLSGLDGYRELIAGRYWFEVRRELGDTHSGEFSLSVVPGWDE